MGHTKVPRSEREPSNKKNGEERDRNSSSVWKGVVKKKARKYTPISKQGNNVSIKNADTSEPVKAANDE